MINTAMTLTKDMVKKVIKTAYSSKRATSLEIRLTNLPVLMVLFLFLLLVAAVLAATVVVEVIFVGV